MRMGIPRPNDDGKARALSIAIGLGRDRSVVSREIEWNGGRDGYRVHAAQERAERQVRRPKVHKLEADRRLHDLGGCYV
jgi:IS30 family transposase